MVLCKPGSITPHNKFTAEVYVLKKEEGGRHTPFFNGYRPQFYFRTTDVTGNGDAAGRHRDGDAAATTSRSTSSSSSVGRLRGGPPVRDPRGRQDRRRRRRDEDPRETPPVKK